MSRKILENFMVDSYSRREGESEEREAIKRLLCEQIDKKIDEEVRKSRIENERVSDKRQIKVSIYKILWCL